MRTFTVHTADELVARWRAKAERSRTVWQDESCAHVVEVCADELEALLLASLELEAAHHGDPDALWPEAGAVWEAEGTTWVHCADGVARELAGDDPNALREWQQGLRT
jgi:hypothetical protein